MSRTVTFSQGWFETVAEAQRRARRRLPKPVFDALLAGSQAGVTREANVTAFDELGFAPHLADLHDQRSLATRVLGQDLALPVLISPTGVQAVHPDGEVAVARAAAAQGTAMMLSCFASKPIAEVVAANPRTFYQVHWTGPRPHMQAQLDRAKAAGAVGLVLTADWSFAEGRDWGSPHLPERLSGATMLRYAPAALRRPGWLIDYLRAGDLPRLTAPNLADPGGAVPSFFQAYRAWQQTPPPSWPDVAWLAEQWAGTFVLKGITTPDDGRRAVDAGAAAISVSNHGGNNLDSSPATLRCLPAVVEAVGDQLEVLLDGGIRRGSDVVKALALGARAVLIGRASLWGLAANGQAGVENVLTLLRSGIDSAVLGLGRADVRELDRTDVVVPPGFTRFD